jgi:uncharacterized membrane protein YgcG
MPRFDLPRFRSLLVCASLCGSLLGLGASAAFAEAPIGEAGDAALSSAAVGEPRVALVIGNSDYQSAPKLANPTNDAQSMAQMLNSAGFEVTQATDLNREEMVKAVQDFSASVAAHGPKTVAMVYYAGHGVQLAGENYLLPVDAKISTPADLEGNSLRLVDIMGTLESTPSRMRIVVLDACRNNPFPNVNDKSRGLAIVDAPNGSIVGYSTAPGMEAQDGDNEHSPYTRSFLQRAREPNLPIEQLFKRVRLDVNSATDGRQTPWESSSLTSEFYFFGDTAVASARAPDRSPIVQTASNLPSRSVREAYDYVLSEASPDYYEEFIRHYPHDPLCDRIRHLLGNWLEATAWHKAVLANSPGVYKAFHDSYANSPYAQSALRLQERPRIVPLMQFTRLTRSGAINAANPARDHGPMQGPGKITTFPAKGSTPPVNAGNNNGKGSDKTANLPAKEAHPIRVKEKHEHTSARRSPNNAGGNSRQHFGASQSRNSFNSMGRSGGHDGGGSGGGHGGGGGGGGRH